jgi:uncharacterized protein (TIGR03086 family)
VEYVPALIAALELQVRVCGQVEDRQLDVESACAGWSVREVMAHSVGVTLKFADFAGGLTDRPHAPSGDLLGADHRVAVRRAAHWARLAWATADRSRVCHLGFGTFPADLAAGINLFDVLAHTWDVAVATGRRVDGADELWAAGLAAATAVIGPARDLAHYAPELRSGAHDPADLRFLRYLGRDGA